MADTATTGSDLEHELEELLEVEKFDPPEEFKRNALWNDPAVYDEANKDHEGWWAKQAEALHWFEKWDQVLDWSNPPFAKWFVGGKLTSPTTASTATSRTATATASPTTGAARRARSATSPTPTCTPTRNGWPTR